jgi:osmotically-inducible protein OsmY
MKTHAILLTFVLAAGCSKSQDTYAAKPGASPSKAASDQAAKSDAHGDSKPVVATDQPENEADRKLTQRVRQAIMDDSALSFVAKNVTVVSHGGTVHLRGVVPSDDQKRSLETTVKAVDGVQRIENQITVEHG